MMVGASPSPGVRQPSVSKRNILEHTDSTPAQDCSKRTNDCSKRNFVVGFFQRALNFLTHVVELDVVDDLMSTQCQPNSEVITFAIREQRLFAKTLHTPTTSSLRRSSNPHSSE
eukprot:COSAG01_NODE_1169_length_11408_cov_35.108056_11_plen_114_part_00